MEEISKILTKACIKAGIEKPVVKLEHPEDMNHGDFTTNIAMVNAKMLKLSPKVLAENIVKEVEKGDVIEKIEVAGPGFINIKIVDSYFVNAIASLSKDKDNLTSFGKITRDNGRKVMVEYTDPNPFKVFHIGHLMANTIGESISRIVEFSGAEVIRACYQGDVGLHVAKTIWAISKDGNYKNDISYLGSMYVLGSEKYETDEVAKKEIVDINKKIFDKSDAVINEIYNKGRKLSLEYFDGIYEKLGTKFNNFFFESEVADDGIRIVKEFLKKGIFEESEGATIFPGEKYGEHTRVFINSQGLPTYEAKELGLTKRKFNLYPDLSESVVVTANEQNAYFKVILATLKEIYPDIALKMKHLSHGILRPSSGKMSSRKGNVVSADELIGEFETLVNEKIKDREFTNEDKVKISNMVAVSGLKYTILRQAIGGDIIYDPTKALSFEGDSGPYLQYATVRAQAVISKAGDKEIKALPEKTSDLERLLVRFPEVISRAREDYAPNYIVTYLTELSSAFNSYYANNQIIDDTDSISPYRIAVTKVFAQVMKNGLWVLGIQVPERM
jgi:arginyl-tRNA synthetase